MVGGIAYGLEKYSALQRSHQTSTPPAVFANTALDWTNDEGSTVNYVTANLKLLRIVPNTEVVIADDFNRSNDLTQSGHRCRRPPNGRPFSTSGRNSTPTPGISSSTGARPSARPTG